MKIMVIGVGYVGLVTGVCLSDFGHEVTCVDTNKDKINDLNAGIIPIFEPGLDDLIDKNKNGGRLTFTTQLTDSIDEAEAIFISVGTPSRRGDGMADLVYVTEAAHQIAPYLNEYKTVILKSTVPVGTNRKLTSMIKSANVRAQFDVVSNPEFLREGSAIEDFMRPDRIIVGVNTPKSADILIEIYRPLYLREYPIMITDPESAELIKYAANAFLATKISFINEISHLCEKVDADVKEVARGMGLDNRIGKHFLHAGPGYGGSCFPKDTLALSKMGIEHNAPQTIVNKVIEANDAVQERMIEKLRDLCDGNFANKRITVLGVTFKPNTDDMREAPSIKIIKHLVSNGALVTVSDPQGRKEGEILFPKVVWEENPYEAVKESDLCVVLTEWNEFRALDLKRIAQSMRRQYFADLRNVYSPNELKTAGFQRFTNVGRS